MTDSEAQSEALVGLVDNAVERVVPAFNAHDAQAFVAVMTEDVVFEHSAAPATMHGRDEVAAFYQETVWTAFPDLTIGLLDGPFIHPHAPRASINWRVVGTHTGLLDPPGLAPTGRGVEMDAREILSLRGSQVSHVRIVIDMADVMRQLGLFPPAGGRVERAMAMMQRLAAPAARMRSAE